MRRLLAAFALCAALCAPASAQTPPVNVHAALHSARAAVTPGERFTVLLRQDIVPGWHTYWRNPGVSGEAMHLTWGAPAGFSVAEPRWPAPSVLLLGPLVSYGYSGQVTFPIEVTAPRGARVGTTAHLRADASWLVCSDQICVPEQTTLALDVPIAAQGRDDPEWAQAAEAASAAVPAPEQTQARITAGAPARLTIALAAADQARNFYFFPFDRNAVRASGAQHARVGPGGVSFELAAGPDGALGRAPVAGVLSYEATGDRVVRWTRRAMEISAQPGDPIADTNDHAAVVTAENPIASLESSGSASSGTQATAPDMGVLTAIAFAFLGGLLLNLMPCVLPVLAVKALSLAEGAQSGQARRQGAFYFVGALATFIALALVLIALRAGGDAVGWGFQLQAPWATSLLALLFFAIGLNLLGAFSFGASLQNAGSSAAARSGDAGAFFTGALAVVAASPCTAPFMAGAIGVALTQSSVSMLLIFAALGIGFALPLTLVHFLPGLQRLIPRPGAWMERLRQVLAFPMFASAAWLVWVLTQQAGAAGTLSLLCVAAALGFTLMVARWGRGWLIAGLVVFAATLAFTWRPLGGAQTEASLISEPWSAARVAQLRAEGRPVFVNFTAAWCITCQANEIAVLSQPRVAEAFSRNRVAYLKADWTNRDPEIAAALAAQGRAGVPLYLYYPAGNGAPVVLPQILSEDALDAAIGEP